MGDQQEYNSDHPEVIRAKAEAEEKVLAARAKLHPVAQVVYTIFDGLGNIIGAVGCLVVIVILAILFFAPTAITGLLR